MLTSKECQDSCEPGLLLGACMLLGLCRMVVSGGRATHSACLGRCSQAPAWNPGRYHSSRAHTRPQLLYAGISNQQRLAQRTAPHTGRRAAHSSEDVVSYKQETPAAAAQPTILTVSWLGANAKPFNKYTQLWHALGYPRVTSIRPPLASIVVPALGQRMACQLAHQWVTTHHSKAAPSATDSPAIVAAADAGPGQLLGAHPSKQALGAALGSGMLVGTPSEATTVQAGQAAAGEGLEVTSRSTERGSGAAAADIMQDRQLQQQQQQQQQQQHAAAGDPGVLIHLFSGGGFIFTAWLMQQLVAQGSPEQLRRIRGIIFDSSPAQVIPDVAARALVAAVLGEPAEKVQERHPLLVGGTSTAVGAYLQVPPIKRTLAEVQDTWAQLAPPCPMLFLHSAADVLVPPEVVQAFMKQQAARGAAVSDKLWPDSPHVDHWRAYPQEYQQQLQQFAARVAHPTTDSGSTWSIPEV